MDAVKGTRIYHIDNALKAGQRAYTLMLNLKSALVGAKRWGYLDIVKGKKIVTFLKRRRIRKAEYIANNASRALVEFNRVLTNLNQNPNFSYSLGRHGVFFDYFFDNAFYDLIVQSRINGNIRKADNTIKQIERILQNLEKEKVELLKG
ncbi:MAG: hypothetical protein Q4P28_03020 [Tissierellia bacterium]|nr:hypothetical protein [Tissierellia bacterium]